jgi:Cell wall-active antibiotics response 4TMS YvqF
MADQSGSRRATWFVVAIVLVGVLIVSIVADHAGLTADRGDHPRLAGVLGSASRSPETSVFDGAEMTALMGSCVLDLRHAQMSPGADVIVDVFAMMGSVVIRVPDEWAVDKQAVRGMGNIRDVRRGAASADAVATIGGNPPRIVLRGLVMMGSLFVRS